MGFTLEFRNSEVRDVVADGDRVRIRFAAASVRRAIGEHGWLPSVALTFEQARLQGDATLAFGKVADGSLRQDSRLAPRLPLPGTLAGAIELTLHFANGTLLTVHAASLRLSMANDARFVEDLSC